MKKIALLILCLVLVFCCVAFTACDDSKTGSESDGTEAGTGDGDEESGETKYTVIWKDELGVTLATSEVKAGDTPSYVYNKSDTAEWDYTFEGWSDSEDGDVLSELPSVSADAIYYAKVRQVKRSYAVSFDSNGGSIVQAQSVFYGTAASIPTVPERSGFHFVGWCKDAALTQAVDWSEVITESVTYYAKWNEKVDIVALLRTLLGGYRADPYSYIPETMQPYYSGKVIAANTTMLDYSTFVNVSSIPHAGYGEQWYMVLKNLDQSQTFFNLLSVVETLSAGSITAFENYMDANPANTASHSFSSGIYSVTIDFDGEILYYVVDYTATIPTLGEQSVQIALSMSIQGDTKHVRMQIGDANALSYTVEDGLYEFAIKYLGVRRAYFAITDEGDGNYTGHIYEYLMVGSVEIASAADFYITEDYVSVVGNKADGMAGFTGYVCEVYDADDGKMLGYEVKETLSAITYNTLWLDLAQIEGINSIKYVAAVGDTPAYFYINGRNVAWASKKVGGLSLKMASRRFDIEFRTQYFYVYDEESEGYQAVAVEVPMLFVQEENYTTLLEDVESTNGVVISVKTGSADLTKIQSDYDTLVDVFAENKEHFSADLIVEKIGEKVTFLA